MLSYHTISNDIVSYGLIRKVITLIWNELIVWVLKYKWYDVALGLRTCDMAWFDMLVLCLQTHDYVMWCDVMRCVAALLKHMVWCGTWCDWRTIWHDTVWYMTNDMVLGVICNVTPYDLINIWYDTVWYDMRWFDIIRCDMIRYGIIWFMIWGGVVWV